MSSRNASSRRRSTKTNLLLVGPAEEVRARQADSRFNAQSATEFQMARTVNCIKLGREAEGLDLPPYPGALGQRIFENVSKEAWQQWIRLQTMLINENRLNLMDARHRKYLAEQVEKHFFGGGADQIQGYVPPPA